MFGFKKEKKLLRENIFTVDIKKEYKMEVRVLNKNKKKCVIYIYMCV